MKRSLCNNQNEVNFAKKPCRDGLVFHQSPKWKTNGIQSQRFSLPIYSARKRLLQEIRQHEVVVVIGETGSGKTTQIPQYLLESGLHKGAAIAVTQPRRIAAVTIAGRVASEMGVRIGDKVGYSVRFEDVTSLKTKIKYMTDGMLLREAMLDPLLKKYSIIIIDEAHERTIHTDVLLGIVKTAQRERRKYSQFLKIIVMSATMDVDSFSKYFNNCPVLYVEGRQFPIKIMYAKEAQPDYLFSTIVTVFQIHQEFPPLGDILVFLTGQEEIEYVTKSIKEIATMLPQDCPPLLVYPLYAALPPTQQLLVFNPTPKGTRKIIIATNVAETSITISGIKYVVDAGYVKSRIYNYRNGLELLKIHRVSQAQAWQRTGRAGRESSGICYRLYTEDEFGGFEEAMVPEIRRCSLSSVVLQMLILQIKDLLKFDFIDSPSSEGIVEALNQLHLLSAIAEIEKPLLTDVGRLMGKFPVDPKFSKIIIASKELGCVDEVLSIIAMLSVETVTFTPIYTRDQASIARKKFTSNEGDLIMYLNIFRAYKKVNGNKQWCQENFIHSRNMKLVMDIRKQLAEICQRSNIPCCSCGSNTSMIRKCFAAGLFMNAAELQPSKDYKTLTSKHLVSIHPSSCLFMSNPSYVIYTELMETSKTYMRNLCLVDPQWLVEVAPKFFKRKVFCQVNT